MKPFERTDEATPPQLASARLQAFIQAVWTALVPRNGECVCIQGELVRANERLCSEMLRNGMSNYYLAGEKLEDSYYGKLLLLILETLIANRNQPSSPEDVAYFSRVRGRLDLDRQLSVRLSELEGGEEQSEQASAELEAVSTRLDTEGVPWEEVFSRAERCIANWCLANPAFVDVRGQPIEDRGMRHLDDIFNPRPPAPKCPLCQGRGFIQSSAANAFPERCSCQRASPGA